MWGFPFAYLNFLNFFVVSIHSCARFLKGKVGKTECVSVVSQGRICYGPGSGSAGSQRAVQQSRAASTFLKDPWETQNHSAAQAAQGEGPAQF